MDSIDRSEELKVAGTHVCSIWYPFHVLIIIKKTSFKGFSFDSHSANDEWQPQMILSHRYCTPTIDSSRGMSLPKWRSPVWCYLLSDFHQGSEVFSSGTILSACFFYQKVVCTDGDSSIRNVFSTRTVQRQVSRLSQCIPAYLYFPFATISGWVHTSSTSSHLCCYICTVLRNMFPFQTLVDFRYIFTL